MMKVRVYLTNGQTLDTTMDAGVAMIIDADLAVRNCDAIDYIEILSYIP